MEPAAGRRRVEWMNGSHSRAQVGLQAQRRHRRIGHADRAADAVLALVPEIGQHAARDMRARLPVAVQDRACVPWPIASDISSCQAGWNSISSMRWPKRSWLLQLRQVAVGVARQPGDARARDRRAGVGQQPVRPSDLLAAGDLDQQAVAGEGVMAGERRGLVHHLVRRVAVRRQRRQAGEQVGGAHVFALPSADAGAQAEVGDLVDEARDRRARPGALGRRERPDQRFHEGADDAGCGHGGIERREGAAHDALAQYALEAARELRPIVQAHRLDLGIDRLGDQGVGQPASAQRAAGEGADRRFQLLDRRAVGIGDRRHDADLARRDGGHDLGAQLGLRGPIAIDRAGRDAGLGGDGVDLGGRPAAVGHEIARRRRGCAPACPPVAGVAFSVCR